MGRNADEEEPGLLGIGAIIDDLAAAAGGIALERLARMAIALHRAVIDRDLCHEGQSDERYPFPEHDVLRHRERLNLRLHLNVKHLQCLWGCDGKISLCIPH